MPFIHDMRRIHTKSKEILRADAKRCPNGHLMDTYKGVSVCKVCK